ncbi:MAG: outer membrane protein assembly factor BamD [Candidatus Omnitrophota bacterium]|nr:outer membrane protein assembly factor BamD [Candidatus Omnitrophota bacterium]MDZ4242173.1 outer membrane protein assembly factor BamD [Candidatus Omnitrophota bacterium]
MSRKILVTAIVFAVVLMFSVPAQAFWVWTPETNKWTNPKYSVKDTPQDQLAYALEFYKDKEYKKTIEEMEKLIKHYPRAREAAEAKYYVGLCYEDQGQLYQAFKEYQVVIEKYPFSERAGAIVEKQFSIGDQLMEGKQKKSKVLQTIAGGGYDVIDVYRTVIKNAPYGPFAAHAQYKIGLYLQEKQLYQEARDEFEKTINDYPESEWAKAARYQIALSDSKRSSGPGYDQKVTRTAVEEFKSFVKDYPDADLSEKAKKEIHNLREKEAENHFLIAAFYEKQKKFDAAKVYYSEVVRDYQNTSWAKKALEKIQTLNTLPGGKK